MIICYISCQDTIRVHLPSNSPLIIIQNFLRKETLETTVEVVYLERCVGRPLVVTLQNVCAKLALFILF